MSRKPCHFFNKSSGCRNGEDCTFSHGSNKQASSPSPSPAAPRTPSCPQGVCHFYWSSGRCDRGFGCRYQHTIAPEAPSVSSTRPESPALSLSATDAIPPFLTEPGLAKLNGNGTDVFFASPATPMSPSEARGSLVLYLSNNFKFKKPADIYDFLIPLSNVSSSNSTWVSSHSLPRSTAAG